MVPDSFDKNHIKEMMNILLCKLGFSSAIIHQVRKQRTIEKNRIELSLLCFCRCAWLTLQSSRFTYSRRLIKFNEHNVQARKLNEAVGFLVYSSLNNLGSTFR